MNSAVKYLRYYSFPLLLVILHSLFLLYLFVRGWFTAYAWALFIPVVLFPLARENVTKSRYLQPVLLILEHYFAWCILVSLVLLLDGLFSFITFSNVVYVFFISLIVYTVLHLQTNKLDVIEHTMSGKSNATFFHISDLHLGHRITNIDEVYRHAVRVNPDAILCTGDIFDGKLPPTQSQVDALKMLTRVAPVYYVGGNHDPRLPGYQKIIKACGWISLENKIIRIQGISIAGLPYMHASHIKKIPRADILLNHVPIEPKRLSSGTVLLCGHTHGGQFFPFHLLSLIDSPIVYGVHTYKSAKTIISNGVGTSGFCTRFLAQAQVGVLRVKKVSKLKKIDID